MLHSIIFNAKWRCFNKGDLFEFIPGVNLIVGEQGCGKSSLLNMIKKEGKKEVTISYDKCPYYYFDYEKMNPRIKNFDYSSADIASRFSSHGEVNLTILKLTEMAKEPSLFLMDEPDMALSVRSIMFLIEHLKQLANNGHQIIASAHNPYLILGFDNILSLEHKQWMNSKDFINIHLGKAVKE